MQWRRSHSAVVTESGLAARRAVSSTPLYSRRVDLRTELRTALALVISAGVAAALNLAYLVLIGRAIGPVEYGNFAVAVSVVITASVAFGPIGSAVARVVAARMPAGEPTVAGIRRPVIRTLGRWTAVAFLIAVPLAPPASRYLHLHDHWLLLYALAASASYVMLGSERGVLHGFGRFGEHNINSLIEAAVRLGAALAALSFMKSASEAFLPYLFATLLAQLLITLRWRRVREMIAIDARAVAETIRIAKPLMLLMLATAVFQNADVLAAKRWLDPLVAGQYAAAATLTRVFGVLFVPLYVMAGPMFVKAQAEGRAAGPVALRLCGYFLAMAALPLALVAIFGRQVMGALYGAEYRAAGAIIALQGGAVIMSYLSLMAAQAHVTLESRWLPASFAALAIAQVVLLVFNHGSMYAIVASLYGIQVLLLTLTVIAFPRARSRVRPEAS